MTHDIPQCMTTPWIKRYAALGALQDVPFPPPAKKSKTQFSVKGQAACARKPPSITHLPISILDELGMTSWP